VLIPLLFCPNNIENIENAFRIIEYIERIFFESGLALLDLGAIGIFAIKVG